MAKKEKILLTFVILALAISGCEPAEISGQTPSPSPTSTRIPSSPSPASQTVADPAPTATRLPASQGPVLLLQTDFDSYMIIDFWANLIYPFTPPGPDQNINLALNLSPSKRQMIFLTDSAEVQILDLAAGVTQPAFELDNGLFDPEAAADPALVALPGIKLSHEAMVSAVKAAYAESILSIRWYEDDRQLLSVRAGTQTTTNLMLDHLQSGKSVQLEAMPGLVQSFWTGPNANLILLKKGFVFEPGVWQDDRYYLVDIAAQEAVLIPLPENADNPSVNWFDANHLSIVHNHQIDRSEDYSLINVDTLESTLIVKGNFRATWVQADQIFLLKHDTDSQRSVIQRLDLDGSVRISQELPGICFRSAIIGEDIFINCETESLRLDRQLTMTPFGEPITILSPAPDRHTNILVTRNGNIYRIDDSSERWQPLQLAGLPLEIRWLPDSSGFLYRTQGELHWYDLESGQSERLIQSDLFSDYTNIHAVWIDLE